MKKHLWLLSIPIIFVAALFQLTLDLGEQGKLYNQFLRESIYPIARTTNGTMTNIKFRLRGPMPVKNNIVVVEADDSSIDNLGRWPWHREVYAQLIHTLFSKMKIKLLGLDVTFSEPEERIPPEVYQLLHQTNPKIEETVKSFEGDPIFGEVVKTYRDRIVLGEAMNQGVQPRYTTEKETLDAIANPEYTKVINEAAGKFALQEEIPLPLNVVQKSPLMYMLTMLANIPTLRDAANYAGLFNVDPDPDGYIRRYPLFMVNGTKIFPTLALKLAELAKDDNAKIHFTNDSRVDRVYFSKTPDQHVPVTSLGYLDLNFYGPSRSFTYVPAFDVLKAAEDPNETKIHGILKDAIVFFGATALGIYDMRAFPFDTNTPGVEGHATALDNILSNTSLRSATAIQLDWLPLALLIALGLIFAALFSRFEAIPSLSIFVGFALVAGAIDIKFLFVHNINIPTAFLFFEILVIFTVILSVRYILEERDKKHIRDAFSHYLAPQVVDMVLKDPEKLTVGGERTELTILFSDLRGFTTISEGLEPKRLSQFLNEYLSAMTDIVFEYEGTLDKYIGDAIMAFWGAPIHQKDHAMRACQAAMKMQKTLREIAPDFKALYNVDVGMGIGINSGIVSVGNMGSKKIFEYTVIGDHVNLASRLEGLNRMYGTDILTSRNTIDSLSPEMKAKVSYRTIDSVKVKGKTQASDLIQISDIPFHQSIIDTYEEAREIFKKREWDTAKALFEKCDALHKQHMGSPDPVVEMFLDRLETFKLNPPDANWDGTIEMRTK